MNKSYYFQHDYNAANDHKVLFLRQQLGMEGYGIFWYVVEQLAQSNGRLPMKIVPVLAAQMQTTQDKVASVIRNYELFEIDEDMFFSARLNKHLDQMNNFKEWGSAGGRAKALKYSKNTELSTPPTTPPTTPSLHNKDIRDSKERKKEYTLPFGTAFSSAWDEWLQYRKDSRHKVTGITIKKQLDMLSKYSESQAVEIINTSIRNGWQGLFELKGKEKKNPYGIH